MNKPADPDPFVLSIATLDADYHMTSHAHKRLSLLLWFIAAHSVCVGIALMAVPDSVLQIFGFTETGEMFFRAQAGVFHLAVAAVYAQGARSGDAAVVNLTVFIKTVAFVFLLVYFLCFSHVYIIALSGVLDGLMAGFVHFAAVAARRSGTT